MALFYALVAIPYLQLHVAHVDHGWRCESYAQCQELKKIVESYRIPFHSCRLSADLPKTEGAAREARYSYFKELFALYSFQALLLAHHGDDCAEGVLKRVCEGAPLVSLATLHPVREMGSLTLWRPLLGISKKEIYQFLQQKKAAYFEDYTNGANYCLRGKIREELFPALTSAFGKEVKAGLLKVAGYAAQLEAYLDRKVGEVEGVTGPFGTYYDLRNQQDPFELSYLARKLLASHKLSVAQMQLEQLVAACLDRCADFSIRCHKVKIVVDRGYLFILDTPSPHFLIKKEGVFENEGITVAVRGASTRQKMGWHHFWKGEAQIAIPAKEVLISLGSSYLPKERARFLKRLSNKKTPSFLRSYLPWISSEGVALGAFCADDEIAKEDNSRLLILEIKKNRR